MREFLSDFNQKAKTEATLDNFKEELFDTVVKFGNQFSLAPDWTEGEKRVVEQDDQADGNGAKDQR